MSVYFNKEAAQIQLNTTGSSYVMQIRDGLLLHLYWGPRLDDRDHSYMHWEQGRAAFSCRMEGCTGPILDDIRLEYPTWGRGDNRSPAAEVIHPNGSNIADFRYVSHTVADGKAPLCGLPAMYANAGDDVQTLEITLEDKVGEMRLTLFYSVFYELDIITAALIGGIDINGGSGKLQGTFLGILIIGILRNGLNLMGLSVIYQSIILGVLLLVAVAKRKG